MFANLNNRKGLTFLLGDSPEELQAQIAQITMPIEIISIYAVGFKHIAWIQTEAKIKKVTKKTRSKKNATG